MVRPLVKALLLLIFLTSSALCFATSSAVDITAESIPLGPWSRVIQDSDDTLSAEQLLARPEHYPGFQGEVVTSFTFSLSSHCIIHKLLPSPVYWYSSPYGWMIFALPLLQPMGSARSGAVVMLSPLRSAH